MEIRIFLEKMVKMPENTMISYLANREGKHEIVDKRNAGQNNLSRIVIARLGVHSYYIFFL
jgi:hypothetical protein